MRAEEASEPVRSEHLQLPAERVTVVLHHVISCKLSSCWDRLFVKEDIAIILVIMLPRWTPLQELNARSAHGWAMLTRLDSRPCFWIAFIPCIQWPYCGVQWRHYVGETAILLPTLWRYLFKTAATIKNYPNLLFSRCLINPPKLLWDLARWSPCWLELVLTYHKQGWFEQNIHSISNVLIKKEKKIEFFSLPAIALCIQGNYPQTRRKKNLIKSNSRHPEKLSHKALTRTKSFLN